MCHLYWVVGPDLYRHLWYRDSDECVVARVFAKVWMRRGRYRVGTHPSWLRPHPLTHDSSAHRRGPTGPDYFVTTVE